jgi:pyridoxal biosynthesis lyase PdxS
MHLTIGGQCCAKVEDLVHSVERIKKVPVTRFVAGGLDFTQPILSRVLEQGAGGKYHGSGRP